MSEEKIIILARPHPFIAKHMKEFLIDQGYTPFPIQAPEDLGNITNTQNVKGAIISTSLTSASGESYVDDFNHLRDKFPELPIMFATLGNIEDMLKPVTHSITAIDGDANVVEVNSANVDHSGLGSKNTYFLVHKDGVANEDAMPVTAKIMAKHFHS